MSVSVVPVSQRYNSESQILFRLKNVDKKVSHFYGQEEIARI